MVKKILHFFSKEIGGLHEAAYLLAVFAVLSQLLALIRDRLFASYFGASFDLDVYYTAFRVPDLIFAAVASLVSISVLVPFLVEKLDKDKEEGKKFIQSIFSIFSLLIVGISIVAFFLMPHIAEIFFKPLLERDTQVVAMARIMLLSPIFLGLSNFFASITQVYRRFIVYATSPLLYNAAIIFGVVVLYPRFGLTGLAWGVALGSLLHCVIQIPFVKQKGLLPRFTFSFDFTSIKKVLLLSLPRTLTVSANEIAKFFLISIASLMAFGSISVFNLAFNLQSVPLSIVGVSYSLAAFPTLVRHFTQGRKNEFVEQMIISAKHIIFWSTPVMVLFIVLRAQIVRTVLGTGEFSWSDTRLTAAALALFVVSIVAQNLSMLFIRGYYSRGNTRRPLIINFICAFLIVIGGFAFTHIFNTVPGFAYFFQALLKVDSLEGASVLMLPLAFSVGSIINVIVHWMDFHREYTSFTRPVLRTLFQSLGGSVIMGAVTYGMLVLFGGSFNLNTLVGVFMQGLLAGLVGLLVYALMLKLLKSAELQEVWQATHRKFWKQKIIVPEQDLA